MIQFKSFKDALNHQKKCPLCSWPLHINDRDLATDWGHEFRGGTPRLTFFLNQREDDTLTIDPDTDEVELVLRERMPDKLFDFSQGRYYAPPQPIYNGKLFHGLTIDCKNCCQYSYTLQIHFNLTEKKLAGVFLNSESISIEECNMVHEIKNVYALEKTEYSYFGKEGDSRSTSLPLIPLDLVNPKETVTRIRKLLIFS